MAMVAHMRVNLYAAFPSVWRTLLKHKTERVGSQESQVRSSKYLETVFKLESQNIQDKLND